MTIKSLKFSKLPPLVQDVLDEIGAAADERRLSAWLVGGMVRDILLGRTSIDVDVVVEGDGMAFAGILAQRLKGECLVHKRFGTAAISLADGIKVDIVTARRETYVRPGALPDVFPGQLADDLFRRDFTVNAIAASLNSASFAEVRDDFDGEADIENGLIRIMHYRSFVDDPTRILRAVRYEKRFGFQMETRTLSAFKVACQEDAFRFITPVRYFNEFRRILDEVDPLPALRRLRTLDGIRYLSFGADEEKALGKVVMRQAKEEKERQKDVQIWHARLAAFFLFLDKKKSDELMLLFNLARADRGRVLQCVSFFQNSGMLINSQESRLGKKKLK